MKQFIENNLEELIHICNRYKVCRLILFGSAASNHFNPVTSDLDLLVEFRAMPPAQHADSYFGLMEDLQHLFGVSIDLLEPVAIRNPYFRQAITENQVVLYEAA